MTQVELAEKAEVSRQTIIAIKQGKFNPSVKLALRFAELFGCKVADISYLRVNSSYIFFSDRTRSKRAGDFQEGIGN